MGEWGGGRGEEVAPLPGPSPLATIVVNFLNQRRVCGFICAGLPFAGRSTVGRLGWARYTRMLFFASVSAAKAPEASQRSRFLWVVLAFMCRVLEH